MSAREPLQVQFATHAQRELRRLDGPVRRRVVRAIDRYAATGHGDVKRLRGSESYRLRVGDWRVIFNLDDVVLVILVLHVRHRREAY